MVYQNPPDQIDRNAPKTPRYIKNYATVPNLG